MQRDGATFTMNPVTLGALLGGLIAFVASGAIRETAIVLAGGMIGASLGWFVRRYILRVQTFEQAIDLRESATKTELYEQAQELGIEGRSSMTKDELVAAITEERTTS